MLISFFFIIIFIRSEFAIVPIYIFFIILKKAIEKADHGFYLYKTILQMWSAFAYGAVWCYFFSTGIRSSITISDGLPSLFVSL
jgi:hypothetical protein